MTADQGLVDQRTNNLEAIGRVRIVTETGVHMETDSLHWINATQKIVSESFVKVTRKNDVVKRYPWAIRGYLFVVLLDYRLQLRSKLQRSRRSESVICSSEPA